jgi:hypothetical protein
VQPIRLKPAAPAAAPAPAPAAAPKPAAAKPAATKKQTAGRTPDFVVAGAPKEPSDEMPLTQRAKLLAGFVASHPKSAANVRRFLYQNSWVVTGAKFGWWHGADALRVLIAADRSAQQRWGIGGKSEEVAQAALAEVEARSK